MNKFIFSFVFLISVLFSSCINYKENNNKIGDIINVNVDVSKGIPDFKFSSIIDSSYRFVKLEVTKNSLVGKISKVIITTEAIYVLDSHSARKLFKFSSNGTFIAVIGGSGEAPGEYQFPMDFAIDKNRIFLLDNGLKVIEYNLNGKYLKSTSLTDKAFSAFYIEKSDEGFVFVTGNRDDNLLLTDESFTRMNSYFPYINTGLDKILINPIQKVDNDYIIYRRFLNDTIYQVDNYSIKPHIYLDFSNRFMKELFSMSITKNKFHKILYQGNSCILKLFYENTESIFFSFFSNKKIYVNYFSKKNRKTYIIPYSSFINDITFEKYTSYPIGITKNCFIANVEPQYFIAGLEKIKDTKSVNSFYYQKALQFSKLIDGNSNPILFIYKLKE